MYICIWDEIYIKTETVFFQRFEAYCYNEIIGDMNKPCDNNSV